jgi:branched-chain amino acid transport system permease protein
LEFLAQLLLNGFIIGIVYALMSLGMTIIYGMMKVVNIAHGEMYMLGGYLTYSFMKFLGLNYFLCIILATLVVSFIGIIIEKAFLHKLLNHPITTTTLLTIGISMFMRNTTLITWGSFPLIVPKPFGGGMFDLRIIRITYIQVFIVLVTIFVLVAGHLFLQRTRIGKSIRATLQNPEMAVLSGIDTKMIFALTFSIGVGLAALGGCLLGPVYTLTPHMGSLAASKSWAVIILGGLGSFPGAIVGGLIVGVAESLAAGYISVGLKEAVAFVVVIFIILYKPEGLFGVRGRS